MKRWFVIAALVVSTACASLSVKQRVSQSHLTAHSVLVALDRLEEQLCQPKPQAVNQCAANPRVITDAQHQAVSRLIAQAAAADARIGEAIIAWKAGTPVPKDVVALKAYALQVQAIARSLEPSGRVSEFIELAVQLLDAVDAIVVGFGGQQ